MTDKAPSGESGWQPIETVLRYGTMVDLWIDGKRITNCQWQIVDPIVYDDEPISGCWISDSKRVTGKPTHWMPAA